MISQWRATSNTCITNTCIQPAKARFCKWMLCRTWNNKYFYPVWIDPRITHMKSVSLNLQVCCIRYFCVKVLSEQRHLAQYTSPTTKPQSVCNFICFILLAKMQHLLLCYDANNFLIAVIYLPDHRSLWCEFAPGSERQSTKSFTTAAWTP